MGLFSSDKGGKSSVTPAQRQRAIRAQKDNERFEKQMKRDQQMKRDRDRGRAKGWW